MYLRNIIVGICALLLDNDWPKPVPTKEKQTYKREFGQ
jgi:hypothetical protein